jgi:hypothetical protein
MELFDIVKRIFDKKGWEKVSTNDKSRNYFMINRIMSIQFPVQANQFNKNKINPAPVVDWWHDTMSVHFKGVPQWIYTKTKKQSVKDKKEDSFDEAEMFVRDKLMISKREILELKKFFPDKYKEWISGVNNQMKGNSNAK